MWQVREAPRQPYPCLKIGPKTPYAQQDTRASRTESAGELRKIRAMLDA